MNFCKPTQFARLAALASLLLGLGARPAAAYTPDSPEVQATVERALKWLETQSDDRLGGKCLMGLAFFKAGRKLQHPAIAAAQAACQTGLNQQEVDNYSLGLALIFLLETDAAKNRELAQKYVGEILRRQQPKGAWSYPNYDTGDTSQTQYPTLGLWLALNYGLDVPAIALEKTCNWLLRTQDPTGAWGYQGTDPGNFTRVQQSEIRPALVAAGLGSLYVCADALGLSETAQPKVEERSLPAALKPVDPEKPKRRLASRAVDVKLVRKAMEDGNRWFAANFVLDSPSYTHYYLYAFERYQSFRELAERRVEAEPKWYDEVVKMLRETQDASGSWSGGDNQVVATSFAVLTLLRSARKTLAQRSLNLGQGVLLGGLGLPANTADLREQDGRLVQSPLAGSAEELLALLEKPGNADLDRLLEAAQTVKLDSEVTRRSGQIARLRALVSAGAYESRLGAVRALGRTRELDNVPLLIYALSDPDLRIVHEADRALRFISRKFDGVGLPLEPKPADVKAAIAAWKAWYLSIRPTARFLD